MILMYFDSRGDASEQGQIRDDGERVRVTYRTTRRPRRTRPDGEAACRHRHRRRPVRRRIYYYYYYYNHNHSHKHIRIILTRVHIARVLRIILLCHPSGDPRRSARRTIGKLSYCPTA